MDGTFLSSPFAVQLVYPFLLIFTIVFAILEKSKILGEGKKQIDAIVSLVIALITISFSHATGIIVNLMPFLAVTIVVVFVFLLIWGFVAADREKGLVLNKNLKVALGIIAGIVLIIAIIVASGNWGFVMALFRSGESNIWSNILLLAIIGGAIAIVLSGGKNSGSSGSNKE